MKNKNRIDAVFEKLKAQNKKALITYVAAGDPDLDTSREVILAMLRAGSDIVEIGVPFSDPVAEGSVIQAASERALKNKLRTDDIFAMVGGLRRETDKPLLLMLYINSIFRYGAERFFSQCRSAGIDGVIVPDLPFEEREEIAGTAGKQGVYVINLVAPTSHERIKAIAENSRGFLYCVSSVGVTGQRSGFDTDFASFFRQINRYADVPTALGFGISTPEQVKELRAYTDGVIVGSAIVSIVGQYGRGAPEKVREFVCTLRKALDE